MLLLLSSIPLYGADFQAGVARVKITPPTPYWLSGYAARTHPAEVVLQDLWAKALALTDPQGHRVVLVTLDVIGLPQDTYEAVISRAKEQYKLAPSELVLNCSHTHGGPAVGSNLCVLFDFNAEDANRVQQYTATLADKVVRLIGEALRNQSPAGLACGSGSAGFAMNRRRITPKDGPPGAKPGGPVDHAVPVLRVTAPDGQLRAVLFGYACHNTTLGGDFYEINGDYAGQAVAELEQSHPGATALFMILCGADQNPNPRGTVELARQHGHELAAEVSRVLGHGSHPVRSPIRTAGEVIPLDLAPHNRQTFEEELKNPDKFRQRRASLMLATYDRGEPIRQFPYPVQAVRFNQDFTLLALAGEVVVDYALRAKREFPGENLVVSGYCHNVRCYIPSKRVLGEGGYEPVSSMIYYALPGPLADTVEEKVFAGIHKVLLDVGAKSGTSSASGRTSNTEH